MFDKNDIKTGRVFYFWGDKDEVEKNTVNTSIEKIDLSSISPNEEIKAFETESLEIFVNFKQIIFEHRTEGGIKNIDKLVVKIRVVKKTKSTR